MGANQSSIETVDEKVFQSETPISFSPDVVNQLSDRLETPETTPERQSLLDVHIRSRIKNELEHLKREEENIRQEIEHALEKENMDKEISMSGDVSGDSGSIGSVKNSAALLGDLEEIQAKIEKHQSNKQTSEHAAVEANANAVADCYRRNKDKPLLCITEVREFKSAVNKLEQQYFHSLP